MIEGQSGWVLANWKMNGSQRLLSEMADALLAMDIPPALSVQLLLPSPYWLLAQQLFVGRDIVWGSQQMHHELSGAYTGALSPVMLQDCGCQSVLVGHSERRQFFHASNALVAEEFVAAQAAGLLPVLCVGETGLDCEVGQAEAVLAEQLEVILSHEHFLPSAPYLVAYEPVWAIGTGRHATPEVVAARHRFILGTIEAHPLSKGLPPILYGGSVKPENVSMLTEVAEVSGVLVGGASLEVHSLQEVIRLCISSHC